MAIAILGWPIDKLPAEVAGQVIDGGRSACADAGIMLAGGHTIDAGEPIFGLAVTGIVAKENLKQNNTATVGCDLYLTKPLGVGILTTAQKQKKLRDEDEFLARDTMCMMNKIGSDLALIDGVMAVTDVTGFGLAGHLSEMCEGSEVNAHLWFDKIPQLAPVKDYMAMGCVPGGTLRNFDSYGHKLNPLTEEQKLLLCDPQTSGGLLIAAKKGDQIALKACFADYGLVLEPIGEMVAAKAGTLIEVI